MEKEKNNLFILQLFIFLIKLCIKTFLQFFNNKYYQNTCEPYPLTNILGVLLFFLLSFHFYSECISFGGADAIGKATFNKSSLYVIN